MKAGGAKAPRRSFARGWSYTSYMWLENLILKQMEKKLLPYRIQAEFIRPDEYRVWLPRIQASYVKATYWHGTGRYHYRYQGATRYESVSTDGVLDVLDSIIRHDGLTPHKDPWIDSGGKTVSLGTVRMHSRLFARIHLYEHDTLLYELGSVPDWVHLYTRLLLLWLVTNMGSCKQFLKSLLRRSTYRDLQSWVGAIRRPKDGKVISLSHFINGKSPDSDIEGNYPILFGIAGGMLEVMDTVPLTHAVEVRSLRPVTLKDFTHIEVPLANVRETEELLRSRGVSLPVLPLEFVDVYLKDASLRDLAYS